MIDVSRDLERMRDYLAGRLPEEERQTFEDRLVRDPALVRELEQTLQLQEGLTALREQGRLVSPVPRLPTYQSWFPTLAAAAIAGVALFFLVHRSAGPASILSASLESTAATPAVAHFTFVSMRGSSAPSLDLPSRGLIEFRASPGGHDSSARYRVTLFRQDEGGTSAPVGELADLAPSTDGYVHLFADASRLSAGRYVLRVEDVAASSASQAFPFNLRNSGARSSP
jgi:hypothetical protein